MAHRESPTTRWYQSQASGLMGSPTVPSTFSDLSEHLYKKNVYVVFCIDKDLISNNRDNINKENV